MQRRFSFCPFLAGRAEFPSSNNNQGFSLMKKKSIWKLYGFAWITAGFFLISLISATGSSFSPSSA